MKLLNRTKVPDDLLTKILVSAGKAVGARTSGVVVQVNPSRNGAIRGVARECIWVRWGNIKNKRRKMNTDEGAFKITLPVWVHSSDNILSRIQSWFQVAMHEWGHIRDYQHGGRSRLDFSDNRRGSKRRPKHDERPEEIRANEYQEEASANGVEEKCADQILDLAIAVEEIYLKEK